MPTTPNTSVSDDIPRITLGGVAWPIPKMAVRQNRHVVPGLVKIMPKLVSFMVSLSANPIVKTEGMTTADARAVAEDRLRSLYILDEETIGVLSDVVYWALTRAHPTLSKNEFEDFEIGPLELVEAVATIGKQTGLMRQPGDEDVPLAQTEGTAAKQ